MDFIKIKYFCFSKDTHQEMRKAGHRLGEKSCKTHDLPNNFYPEYVKDSYNGTGGDQPIFTQGKDLSFYHFSLPFIIL